MLKINPQHTIPFLDENGFYLAESSAILYYLADSRAPESTLLGRFPKKRATIHHRLHYFCGTIWPTVGQLVRPLILGTSATLDKDVKDKLFEALTIADSWVIKAPFIAGDFISIADFLYISATATLYVSSFNLMQEN